MQSLYTAGNPTILPNPPALAILQPSRHLLQHLLPNIRAFAAANFLHLPDGSHLKI